MSDANENYEAISIFEELRDNSTDFYAFAPTFFLWDGNLDNDCIKLGENFQQALLDDEIQTEPTRHKAWITQGNINTKLEANFASYKDDKDLKEVLTKYRNVKPWEKYKRLIQISENNEALKQKYYDQFSKEWGNCARLYNKSLYKGFWKKTLQECLIILSIPFLIFAAGAFLIRFGRFFIWPFNQAGKALKFVFRWLAQGFKGD